MAARSVDRIARRRLTRRPPPERLYFSVNAQTSLKPLRTHYLHSGAPHASPSDTEPGVVVAVVVGELASVLVVALPTRSLYQLTVLIVLCDCVHMFGVGGVSVGMWRVLCVEGGGLAYGSGHSVPPYAATLCAK